MGDSPKVVNNMVKPIATILTCYKPLSATRFWDNFRVPLSGWLLLRNMDSSASIRLHWDSAGDEDGSADEIKPLHYKPFQVDEGDMLWISSATTGTRVKVELAKYKPVMQDWTSQADEMVENIPYCASGVAVTTTYNLSPTPAAPATTDIPMVKGYGTYFQVLADIAGFAGTLEVSADNGVTYSSTIVINSSDPNKMAFKEHMVFNRLRITKIGGATFSVYMR